MFSLSLRRYGSGDSQVTSVPAVAWQCLRGRCMGHEPGAAEVHRSSHRAHRARSGNNGKRLCLLLLNVCWRRLIGDGCRSRGSRGSGRNRRRGRSSRRNQLPYRPPLCWIGDPHHPATKQWPTIHSTRNRHFNDTHWRTIRRIVWIRRRHHPVSATVPERDDPQEDDANEERNQPRHRDKCRGIRSDLRLHRRGPPSRHPHRAPHRARARTSDIPA